MIEQCTHLPPVDRSANVQHSVCNVQCLNYIRPGKQTNYCTVKVDVVQKDVRSNIIICTSFIMGCLCKNA